MRTIKKYELKEEENRIVCPISAIVLAAGAVGEKIMVWMETETEEIEVGERPFLVVKDEETVDERMVGNFIGVAMMKDGEVWIVFEIL